ncbi:MAG: dihydrofolate reductase family protein [Sphingobacteriales bacterium]|nr:dihydrofolate reductase family protein [Sphingobacteriales bacterium]
MGKLIISLHISIDGFVAGPNGEMDWIGLDDTMFDYVCHLTDNADTALYGRKTFEMMDAYWPTAGNEPNASKHDKEHSAWYLKVNKYVLSNTMQGKDNDKIHFIKSDLETIKFIKKKSANSVLIFGSPSAIHYLFSQDLVDEMYLFVNPILLGNGISLFNEIKERLQYKLASTKTFESCQVVCLHYNK